MCTKDKPILTVVCFNQPSLYTFYVHKKRNIWYEKHEIFGSVSQLWPWNWGMLTKIVVTFIQYFTRTFLLQQFLCHYCKIQFKTKFKQFKQFKQNVKSLTIVTWVCIWIWSGWFGWSWRSKFFVVKITHILWFQTICSKTEWDVSILNLKLF